MQNIKITKELHGEKEVFIIPALVFQNKDNFSIKKVAHPQGNGIMEFNLIEEAIEAIKLAGFNPILPSGETVKQTLKPQKQDIKSVIQDKLLNLLNDPNPQVQANAIYALGEMKDFNLLPIFIQKIGEDNETIRNNAIDAILNFGHFATNELKEALKSSNWVTRKSILTIIEKLTIAQIVTPECFIEGVLEKLDDSNNIVKCSAITTLGKIYKMISNA